MASSTAVSASPHAIRVAASGPISTVVSPTTADALPRLHPRAAVEAFVGGEGDFGSHTGGHAAGGLAVDDRLEHPRGADQGAIRVGGLSVHEHDDGRTAGHGEGVAGEGECRTSQQQVGEPGVLVHQGHVRAGHLGGGQVGHVQSVDVERIRATHRVAARTRREATVCELDPDRLVAGHHPRCAVFGHRLGEERAPVELGVGRARAVGRGRRRASTRHAQQHDHGRHPRHRHPIHRPHVAPTCAGSAWFPEAGQDGRPRGTERVPIGRRLRRLPAMSDATGDLPTDQGPRAVPSRVLGGLGPSRRRRLRCRRHGGRRSPTRDRP